VWRESPGVRCRGFPVCGYGRGVLLLGLFPSGTQTENRGNAFARHIGRRVQAYAQSARERRDRRAARREGPAWRGRRHRAPMLRQWAADASLSGIAEFARLGEKIDRRHFDILRTTRAGLSNARLEAVNNKIKHHQDRLRLQEPRQPHRPDHAQMRRTQPPTPRTPITRKPDQ